KGFQVKARAGTKEMTWNPDRVVANIGYTPDTALYRELQVQDCYATLGPAKLAAALAASKGDDCLKQISHGAESLRNREPNFYILGAKSYGRNANFLLNLGFEQVREVFRLIEKET